MAGLFSTIFDTTDGPADAATSRGESATDGAAGRADVIEDRAEGRTEQGSGRMEQELGRGEQGLDNARSELDAGVGFDVALEAEARIDSELSYTDAEGNTESRSQETTLSTGETHVGGDLSTSDGADLAF